MDKKKAEEDEEESMKVMIMMMLLRDIKKVNLKTLKALPTSKLTQRQAKCLSMPGSKSFGKRGKTMGARCSANTSGSIKSSAEICASLGAFSRLRRTSRSSCWKSRRA